MDSALKEHQCKSCSNRFTGNYCNVCGEKVLTSKDRSFKTFFNSILVAITFSDSTFIKTLWQVIINPGFIAKEFVEGRRVTYLKPISLFFVLNLIYFLFPVIQLFNASLNTQLMEPHAGFLKGIIADKIDSLHLNIDSFSMIYNLKTATLAKMMVMVFVFFASLPLNLLYRKRNRFFTDHIDYCIELASFNLFVNAILLTLVARVLHLGAYVTELSVTNIFIITNMYFLVRSSHTFYKEKGWRLILKSVFMLAILKLALELYRLVLFFVTIWTL